MRRNYIKHCAVLGLLYILSFGCSRVDDIDDAASEMRTERRVDHQIDTRKLGGNGLQVSVALSEPLAAAGITATGANHDSRHTNKTVAVILYSPNPFAGFLEAKATNVQSGESNSATTFVRLNPFDAQSVLFVHDSALDHDAVYIYRISKAEFNDLSTEPGFRDSIAGP